MTLLIYSATIEIPDFKPEEYRNQKPGRMGERKTEPVQSPGTETGSQSHRRINDGKNPQ